MGSGHRSLMIAAAEFDRVSRKLFVWHRYDLRVKADLFATGLETDTGLVLIDPFSDEAHALAEAVNGAEVAGVVITNANHVRSCVEFAERCSVPLYAHRETQGLLNLPFVTQVAEGSKLAHDTAVISVAGAAPGEIALHCTTDGGTVIFGDALINFGAAGFSLLPGKYCSNSKVLRKSLRRLLDFHFERILFAHGPPILQAGRERLEQLLA